MSTTLRNTGSGWFARIIENSKIMTIFLDSAGDITGCGSALCLTFLPSRKYPSSNISGLFQVG